MSVVIIFSYLVILAPAREHIENAVLRCVLYIEIFINYPLYAHFVSPSAASLSQNAALHKDNRPKCSTYSVGIAYSIRGAARAVFWQHA